MKMPGVDVAAKFKALYPEELVERYRKGERDFVGINLLRAELEHIFRVRHHQPVRIDFSQLGSSEVPKWYTPFFDVAVNPLWADYKDFDSEFEWDSGIFIPTEYDDLLPPRDLTSLDLSGINLAGAYLYPVNFSGTNLTGADLRKAKLFDANLQGAVLRYSDMRRANLNSANLQGADLYMAKLQRAAMTSTNLEHANLRRAKLRKAVITSSDLRGAYLERAHFERTWLNYSKLQNVDLSNVELRDCVVTGVSVTHSQKSDFLAALKVRLVS
jgi:uncharacterized protein YjbI with pentapeptide repeats